MIFELLPIILNRSESSICIHSSKQRTGSHSWARTRLINMSVPLLILTDDSILLLILANLLIFQLICYLQALNL